jgi:hypothetical protein
MATTRSILQDESLRGVHHTFYYGQAPAKTQGRDFAPQVASLKRPGQIILRFQENGHITLPWNQLGKLSSGTVSVYATSQPSPNDMFTAIHNVWTSDGTGGDKRGYLIA